MRTARLGVAAAVMAGLGLLGEAAGQPAVSPLRFLPGDAEVGGAVDRQEVPQIAAGGAGYLVVWQDRRTITGSFPTNGDALSPDAGNKRDIYAMRLDASGLPMDAAPIIVSSEGQNQTRPMVAWNGENWLVVWMTQRPDWYFFDDVVGVRVSPAGEVLDASPIQIRPEQETPANDYAADPVVGSDGTNWVVVWQDQAPTGHPTLEGTRIGPDGTVLDPLPGSRTFMQTPVLAFGPRRPAVAYADGVYLVTWLDLTTGSIRGVRASASDLSLIDAQPIVFGASPTSPWVQPPTGSNGSGFAVAVLTNSGVPGVPYYHKLYRIGTSGPVIDPAGVRVNEMGGGAPQIAWNGTHWVMAWTQAGEVQARRVAPDGSLPEGAPVVVEGAPTLQEFAVIASRGDGDVQVVWSDRNTDSSNFRFEDVRGRMLAGGLTPGALVEISSGLPRQTEARSVSHDGIHAVAFASEVAGRTAVKVQRVNQAGIAIDAEPVTVAVGAWGEDGRFRPGIAWNGSVYFVVFPTPAGLSGVRLSPELAVLDATPIPVLTQYKPLEMDVAALGSDFLVASPYQVSGDLSYIHARRVSGAGQVLDATPIQIGFNFAKNARVAALGGRWLVVWESQGRHDVVSSTIRAVFVDGAGVPAPGITLGAGGDADMPEVAAAGDRALVVWDDGLAGADDKIEGSILAADGAPLTGEILIATDVGERYGASAAFDGAGFTVAWTDYRGVQGIEQERGDIYAARVTLGGEPLDPAGFPLTQGPMPENYPEVMGGGGRSVVAFSHLGGLGGVPEVQRLAVRVVGGCREDWDGSGSVNSGDIAAFLTAWLASLTAGDLGADFNGDGAVNSADISVFLTAWLAAVGGGC